MYLHFLIAVFDDNKVIKFLAKLKVVQVPILYYTHVINHVLQKNPQNPNLIYMPYIFLNI